MSLKSETVFIGGKEFSIGVLPLQDARKVYSRCSRILALFSDTAQKDTGGLGAIMSASMAGALPDEDLAFLIQTFGPVSTVRVGEKTFNLGTGPAAQDIVFDGKFEDLLEWLDVCFKINFGGVIAKLQGALQSRLDAVRPETATEPASLSQKT